MKAYINFISSFIAIILSTQVMADEWVLPFFENNNHPEYKNEYYVDNCFLSHVTIPKNNAKEDSFYSFSTANLQNMECKIERHQSDVNMLECSCLEMELCVSDFMANPGDGMPNPTVMSVAAIRIGFESSIGVDKFKYLHQFLLNETMECSVKQHLKN